VLLLSLEVNEYDNGGKLVKEQQCKASPAALQLSQLSTC
jgi:hypothetical protein